MKKRIIIANWKSHENLALVDEWFKIFVDAKPVYNKEEKIVIICPPFTFLPKVKELIDKDQLAIGLGAQDVSPFDQGAYTGEVNASQIKEFGDYVIIGHSERRKYFNETDEMLAKKVNMALQKELMPIFCVQDETTPIPAEATLVAYEPIFAIGSGKPDTPENAEQVISMIKSMHPTVQYVLYGGSVSGENVHHFTNSPSIDGTLVGGASLLATEFIHIISNS